MAATGEGVPNGWRICTERAQTESAGISARNSGTGKRLEEEDDPRTREEQ